MGTSAPLTALWEVLRSKDPTNMNKFLATLLMLAAAVSAEADPYLLSYHGLGYAGYPAYAGYSGYAGYALPYAASGYASVSPSASLTTLGAAPAAIPAVGGAYAGAGRYVANSAGYGYGLAGFGSYSPSAGVSIAGHAPAALPAVAGAYAGAGRYCANSAGTIHCA